ncbi:MAG: hypothetical protein QWI36_03430 [Wolbachia endosymbiont of Tyrophagus putrescentiae]|nr:hypothetical protein [Wolbachia endosymbiont of Tyrophagus putrescentiae]
MTIEEEKIYKGPNDRAEYQKDDGETVLDSDDPQALELLGDEECRKVHDMVGKWFNKILGDDNLQEERGLELL